MRKLFTILICLFIGGNAYPKEKTNDFLLLKALNQLGLKKADINEEFYAEKVLPYSKSESVMAIPKYRKNEADGDGNRYFELDAYVLIVNNATGKILYKYYEENAWTSDAVMLLHITIDTGLYKLASNIRAFGIRVGYRGSSNPNPYNQTDLSLFIVEKKSLKKVLNNYPISEFHGEWDTRCAGEFEEIEGIIDIETNQTNGLHNLIVKQTIINTKNVPVKDDCIEKTTTRRKIKKLKYNGAEYK